jgi:hypothetical protein
LRAHGHADATARQRSHVLAVASLRLG